VGEAKLVNENAFETSVIAAGTLSPPLILGSRVRRCETNNGFEVSAGSRKIEGSAC
jgi:hypothetical protein